MTEKTFDQKVEKKDKPENFENLISSVEGDLAKSIRESVKAKIKTLLETKRTHIKAIAGIDIEIAKLKADFESGIL